jgi:TPR repeat protein
LHRATLKVRSGNVKKILLIVCVLVVAAGVAALIYNHSISEAPEQAPPIVKPAIDITALKAKAEQGDPQGQLRLGKAFAEGQGVPLDYKQAAYWYGLAATNGNSEGQADLGELYQAGQGVKRDLTNAARLFTQAAQGGNVTGQFDLAYLYENGQGVPKNQQLAAKWYGQAAEAGDPMAQFFYGQRCLSGFGLAKDPVEALKWFRLAAEQGQIDAKAALKAAENGMTSAQIAEARQRAVNFVPRAPAK